MGLRPKLVDAGVRLDGRRSKGLESLFHGQRTKYFRESRHSNSVTVMQPDSCYTDPIEPSVRI